MKNPLVRDKYKALNKKKKQEILKRDDYTCQECGNKEKLQVHHIVPYLAGGSESPDNLITLCANCHSVADGGWRNKVREWRKEEEKQPGYYDDLPDWLKSVVVQPKDEDELPDWLKEL